MRSIFLAASLVAGCGTDEPTGGTLAYIDSEHDVHILDVATRTDRVVTGKAVALTIAPDGQHIAFANSERSVGIVDRSGRVVPVDGPGIIEFGAWSGPGVTPPSMRSPTTAAT